MTLDLLTVAQVADKLGVLRQQVYKWIYAKRMPAVDVAGRTFVERRHAKKPKDIKPGPKPEGRLEP